MNRTTIANEALWVDEQAYCKQRGTCRCGTSTGERSRAILDQHMPSPIDEVGEEPHIHRLRTNIFAPEEQLHLPCCIRRI
jgi:hypothetical protein